MVGVGDVCGQGRRGRVVAVVVMPAASRLCLVTTRENGPSLDTRNYRIPLLLLLRRALRSTRRTADTDRHYRRIAVVTYCLAGPR